ncbi:MAG: MoaD/ThiS family protein [Planctomycetota bacterium]
MRVEVRLFATFRNGRFKQEQLDFPEESSLAELLKLLRIPAEQVGILLVNGRPAASDCQLSSHDVVSIFPALGGG